MNKEKISSEDISQGTNTPIERVGYEEEFEGYSHRSGKLKVLKNLPKGFVIRALRGPDAHNAERAESLFKELSQNYHINVAERFLVRDRDPRGNEIVYQAVQNLEQKDFTFSDVDDLFDLGRLERVEDRGELQYKEDNKHFQIELKKLFKNLTKYLLDKERRREDFLWDIFKFEQYAYARRLYDVDYKFYLIDTDPWIESKESTSFESQISYAAGGLLNMIEVAEQFFQGQNFNVEDLKSKLSKII